MISPIAPIASSCPLIRRRQVLLQVDHVADLVAQHPAQGNAGPVGDDLGDHVRIHLDANKRRAGLDRLKLLHRAGEFSLQLLLLLLLAPLAHERMEFLA